jgi:D-arabinan endo alpha-(1,5)-arabinofuranosidase
MVAALTGPQALTDQKVVDVCGTDIGTMTELNGRIFFAFGDTFGYDGDICRGIGGPNWRSNVFAATTDRKPADGIELQRWLRGADGRAIAVIEGAHQPPFTGTDGEQTKIPTAMIAVGDQIHLHYMSVHGFAPQGGVWECNFSKWVYSADEGRTWRACDLPFGGRDSNFNMLALTNEAGNGNEKQRYVYALGTPCGRFGGTKLARVQKHRVLDSYAWQYLAGYHGDSRTPRWSDNANEAIQIVPPPVGEGSVLWNPALNRWMYTYLNEHTASLETREAEHLWGPWSVPNVLTTTAEFPQLYGAFMTPSLLRDGGHTLYFVMSQFEPYNTFIMKAELTF